MLVIPVFDARLQGKLNSEYQEMSKERHGSGESPRDAAIILVVNTQGMGLYVL
jgi:hypothetical protein